MLAKPDSARLVNFDALLAEKKHITSAKVRLLFLSNDMTQPNQPTLLLVDTNAEAVFATANELSVFGYRVLIATSVDQAIAIGRHEAFELLLCCEPLDIADPQTLWRFLRRNKRLRQLRLVIKQPCQLVGVRLKVIYGEPVYCMGKTASIDAIHRVVKQTLAMEISRPQPPRSHANVPYLKFNQRERVKRPTLNFAGQLGGFAKD